MRSSRYLIFIPWPKAGHPSTTNDILHHPISRTLFVVKGASYRVGLDGPAETAAVSAATGHPLHVTSSHYRVGASTDSLVLKVPIVAQSNAAKLARNVPISSGMKTAVLVI